MDDAALERAVRMAQAVGLALDAHGSAVATVAGRQYRVTTTPIRDTGGWRWVLTIEGAELSREAAVGASTRALASTFGAAELDVSSNDGGH